MSDETPNTDDNNTSPADSGNEPKGFTAGQQKQIDDLTDKTYSKAYSKAMTKINAESKEAMDAVKEELAELKVDKGNKTDDKGQSEDLTAMKTTLDSLTEQLAKEQGMRSRESLKSIAAEMNSVNSDQVATLVSPFVKHDGDKTTILNEKGQTRFNESGEEMTTQEFLAEYLGKNPHLVKASGNGGSGSQGSKFNDNSGGKTITRAEFAKLSPMQQSKIARADEVAIVD